MPAQQYEEECEERRQLAARVEELEVGRQGRLIVGVQTYLGPARCLQSAMLVVPGCPKT